MAVVVAAGSAAVAAVALLVVGFALSPIVPTALSLAGRSAPGRSATAVSLVTTIGYSAFVAGPPLVGALAGLTSLRTALVPVVISTAAIALLARRLPRPGDGLRLRLRLAARLERQVRACCATTGAAGASRWTTAPRSPATSSTSTPRPASGRRSTSRTSHRADPGGTSPAPPSRSTRRRSRRSTAASATTTVRRHRLVDADLGGRVWAYVGSAAGRARCAEGRAAGTAVVAAEYLALVPDENRRTCRSGRYSGVT